VVAKLVALVLPLGLDTFAVAATLGAIGVLLYTLLASEQEEETRLAEFAQMRGVGAIMLGVSISLDELAVGFTLGLLRLPAGLVIGPDRSPGFIVTQPGLRLGARLSVRLREGAERLAERRAHRARRRTVG
jgi:putative Mn2+ efflux pump MntP